MTIIDAQRLNKMICEYFSIDVDKRHVTEVSIHLRPGDYPRVDVTETVLNESLLKPQRQPVKTTFRLEAVADE